MIEIPDPPTIAACGSCQHPLRWFWTPTRQAWVAFVATDDRLTIRFHECRPLQAPATWRALSVVPASDQAQINAQGRRLAEQALKTRTEGEEQR